MENQLTQNVKTVSRVYVLILGALFTVGLFLLGYFSILHLNFEVVLAPFIVITLLAYGEELVFLLFLIPIGIAANLIMKLNSLYNKKNN
jgi:hypothetical protein